MKKILLFVFLGLFSCQQNLERKELESVGAELKNRKIKRVTDAQITTFAYQKGQEIAQILQQSLQKVNTENLDCQNIGFQGLNEKFEFLLTYRLICDSTNKMEATEKEIWKAYQYNISNKLTLSDNLQKLPPNQYLFTSPCYINGKFRGMWTIIMSKKELVKLI